MPPTTTIGSPRELFLHKLGEAVTAEKTQLKVLPRLAKMAKDEQLSKRLQQHEQQTRQQLENVEQAFRDLGSRARATPSPALEGIVREGDETAKMVQGETQDAVTASAAGAAEHFEIGLYTDLVTMARAMGQTEVARTLEANLKQEKEMLRDVEKLSRQRVKQLAQQEKQSTQTSQRSQGSTRSRSSQRSQRSR